MNADYIPLYNGVLKANRIGTFTRDSLTIDIIRPGYDAQARRRTAWTQFVVDGVPIFEVKMRVELNVAMKKFDDLWAKYIADEPSVLTQALANCHHDHISKFLDGVTGEPPAPSLTHDGRGDGKEYPG